MKVRCADGVTANDLRLALDAHVFSGLDRVVEERECVGRVGVNGSGKSTLLQIATGLQAADSRPIDSWRNAVFAHLAQEPRLLTGATLVMGLLVPQGRTFAAKRDAFAQPPDAMDRI